MYRNLDINSIIYQYLEQNNELLIKIIKEKLDNFNLNELVDNLINTKLTRSIEVEILRRVKDLIHAKFEYLFEKEVSKQFKENYIDEINEIVKKTIKSKDLKKYVQNSLFNISKDILGKIDFYFYKRFDEV